MEYIIIEPNGTRKQFKPAGSKITLEEMQSIVGGYVEKVKTPHGDMLVNEDGRMQKLQPNYVAATIAHTLVVGTVLLCMREGSKLPFYETKEQV